MHTLFYKEFIGFQKTILASCVGETTLNKKKRKELADILFCPVPLKMGLIKNSFSHQKNSRGNM